MAVDRRSWYDLTPCEREAIADRLDLMDPGGPMGIALRHYRDTERSMARTPKGKAR